MAALTYIGNLWKRVSRSGGEYLSGRITTDYHIKRGQKLLLFVNDRRMGERSPDYKLCLAWGKENKPSGQEKQENDFEGGDE